MLVSQNYVKTRYGLFNLPFFLLNSATLGLKHHFKHLKLMLDMFLLSCMVQIDSLQGKYAFIIMFIENILSSIFWYIAETKPKGLLRFVYCVQFGCFVPLLLG